MRFTVQIPQPCHERWADMQPTEQGRFCASCRKTVVDYTAFSDRELVRLLSKSSEASCGRFHNDQLNRPLIQSNPGTTSVWHQVVGLLTMGLFGWQTARAQLSPVSRPSRPVSVQPVSSRPEYSVATLPVRRATTGTDTWTVTGNVMISDSTGKLSPVSTAHVSITQMGQFWKAQTDSTGTFRLSIPAKPYATELTVWVSVNDHLHEKVRIEATPSTALIVLHDVLLRQPAYRSSMNITGGGIAIIEMPSRWQRFKRRLFH